MFSKIFSVTNCNECITIVATKENRLREYSKQEIAEELMILEKAKNNPRHFSWLYEKHYKQVFLFIYRRTTNHDLTGDLCSQVFLKAMNNLHKYQFRGLPFITWLLRVASNEVNMHFRKNKNNRSISLEDAGLFRLSEEVENSDRHLLCDAIIDCLEHLREDEVELIELRYFENHSVKEVAYILNESESNIKVKTHRTVKKLKLIIGERFNNE